MKNKTYLWIFIGVAFVLCVALLIASGNLSRKRETAPEKINRQNVQMNSNDSGVLEVTEVDLSQEGIDFEEDASDLSDDFINDASFDDAPSLDSVEGEVY